MAIGQVASGGVATVAAVRAPASERDALGRERRFYVAASLAMLIITVVGFRAFVLRGGSASGAFTPQIVGLIVIHGLAMLGWVTLLLVQSLLIVGRRVRIHMTLGKLGAGLAAFIVVAGIAAGSLSVHFNPRLYDDSGGPRYFLAIMISEMVTFGGLVALGVGYRRRPEVHRPMMLLATVSVMGASLARWPHGEWLRTALHGNVWAFIYGQMLVLGATLFVLHAAMTRRAFRHYVIGYACLAAVTLVTVLVGATAAWDRIAALIVP